ncbi:MAG TPA: hypothetical protein VMZ11_02670 [Mycobacteriales bacterium]|nr:hypothetical protein [Mycobacteriales bacterium]
MTAADPRQVFRLRTDPVPDPDLVLVPTDAEGALEAAALAPRLQQRGRSVRLSLVWPADLALLPAGVLDEVQDVRLLEPLATTSRHLVLARGDGVLKHLMGAMGRRPLVARPTGTATFEAFRRGATRRWRSQGLVLLRSRLEVAEIGDRAFAHVPSGARFALDAAAPPSADPVVLLPASVARAAALEPLVREVVEGLSRAGARPLVLASPPFARHLQGLEVAAPRAELLRGTVVLPDCPEVGLVRALGGRPVVMGPTGALTTRRWAELHPPGTTADQVLAQLDAPGSGPDALTELADAALDVDGWVELVERALEAPPAG